MYRRAARTNLIIKIVSSLWCLMIKLFATGCFGRLDPWKCLYGQSEGRLGGWLKIQPWALACTTQPGNMCQSAGGPSGTHERDYRTVFTTACYASPIPAPWCCFWDLPELLVALEEDWLVEESCRGEGRMVAML